MKRVLLVCLVALLVGLALAATTSRAKAAAPSVTQTGYVTVRDGTLLKYTVVRPAGPGPFPTLFTYDGYDAGSNPDPGYVAQYVPEGYAFIGVSLRGTGCSGGGCVGRGEPARAGRVGRGVGLLPARRGHRRLRRHRVDRPPVVVERQGR